MSFERIMRRSRPPGGVAVTVITTDEAEMQTRAGGPSPPEYRRETVDGMVIDYDISVQLRDGVQIYLDLFRPEGQLNELPAILGWSPYGKHVRGEEFLDRFPSRAGVRDEWWSDHVRLEGPDPVFWCAHGYAVVSPDTRGTWFSEGDATFLGEEEGRDCADVIEWAGTQDWSNGKVGLSGPSYFSVLQWFAAAEQPPHLAAINPWEGWSDLYRDFYFHGGIPETRFSPWLNDLIAVGLSEAEDLNAMREAHPFFDEYWETKAAKLERVKVPALVGACMAKRALHFRGSVEGFKGIASEQKWLDLHGRRQQARFRAPQAVARQLAFFDHFLKGVDNDVPRWPRVLLEVQERAYVGEFRAENEWPLARTQEKALFLDARERALVLERPTEEATIEYDAREGQISFDYRFDTRTELIGNMKLRLWVEADGSDDMDLFVAIEKLDNHGRLAHFVIGDAFFDGPVSLGWLRVSHRELDEARATALQPVLAHRREQRLAPGEIVPVDIEIEPSSTIFFRGDTLRVTIAGHDLDKHEYLHEQTRNAGTHRFHTGGRYDAHLLVPEIPFEPRPSLNTEGAPDVLPMFD